MDDLARRHLDLPLDVGLATAMEAAGLRARLVDADDEEAFGPWHDAAARGFLGPVPSDGRREAAAGISRSRRVTGIQDPTAPRAQEPVGTSESWAAELSVPGGVVPVCAISTVTVAPTHRRRGLLRAMLTAELRTAVRAGIGVAALTVSESAIYGRFGFAPAALAADVTIDVRRAGWIGPMPAGRVDFVSREQGRALAQALHDRTRTTLPGEVDRVPAMWDSVLRLSPGADKPETLRVVQYTAPGGDVDGYAAYTVQENHDDFAASTVRLERLEAATDDAYAALWRFLLSLDLIGTLTVGELSVDEPLWWMVADRRAATVTVRDHHYLRVLDVPAVLGSRRYAVADSLVLDVSDPEGFAAGRFLLRVGDGGTAEVVATADVPPGACVVELGVAELSALALGGTSAVTLARAGRLRTDDAARVTRLLAWHVPPQLTYWS